MPVDVSLLLSVDIEYRKPNWTTGFFPGTFTTGTTCWYDIVNSTDIGPNDYGLWTVWAKMTFLDGDFTYTTPFTFKAVRPGYGGCS